MQIHRRSIVVTLLICLLTLVFSIVITVSSDFFNNKWYIYLVSLTISIFASSLLLLFNSILSYSIMRKSAAGDSIQLLCDIFESQAKIALHFLDNQLPNKKISLKISQMRIIDESLCSFINLLKRFVGSEKIAWPRPSFLLRFALKKTTSLYYIEATVMVNCYNALEKSSICHLDLLTIIHSDGIPPKTSVDAFVKSWNALNECFCKGGSLNKLLDQYTEVMRKV